MHDPKLFWLKGVNVQIALYTKSKCWSLTWPIRDDSRIQISIFALKVTSLKPCKCNPNFQVYLLPSIHSQCLISVWLNKILHSLQNVLFSNRGKSSTMNSFSSILDIKTSTLNNFKTYILPFSVTIQPQN
uniref:Uncharacterized protein n=1 Tax=Opuntia streptacantha TaxID=393608 RepID=A0A7C9EWD8_OPUST